MPSPERRMWPALYVAGDLILLEISDEVDSIELGGLTALQIVQVLGEVTNGKRSEAGELGGPRAWREGKTIVLQVAARQSPIFLTPREARSLAYRLEVRVVAMGKRHRPEVGKSPSLKRLYLDRAEAK